MLAVEQHTPGGVGIADRAQAGGSAGVIQGGRATLVEDQVLGGLGRTGVLHQAQRVDQAAADVPAQEQAAGRPVVQIKAAAGKEQQPPCDFSNVI